MRDLFYFIFYKILRTKLQNLTLCKLPQVTMPYSVKLPSIKGNVENSNNNSHLYSFYESAGNLMINPIINL